LVELEKELLTQVEIIKLNAREREEILSNQLSDSNEQLQKEIENRIKLLEKIEHYEIQFNLVSTDFLGENESFDISSSDTPNMEENYNQIDRYFEGNKKQNKRINNNTNSKRNNNNNNHIKNNSINNNNNRNNIKNDSINSNNNNNINNNNNSNSINDSLENDKNLSFLNNTNEDLLENYVLEEERELNLESRQNQNNTDIDGYNNNNNDDNYTEKNDDDNNDNNNYNNNYINYNSNNSNNKMTIENNNKLIIRNKLNQSNDFSVIFEICLLLEKKLETIINNQKKSTIRKFHENGEIMITENLNFTEIITSALTDSLEKTKIDFSDNQMTFQSSLNMIKRFSNVLFSLSDSLQFPLSNKRFSESVNESILSLTRNNIRYGNMIL
jgi:hypothetical protein